MIVKCNNKTASVITLSQTISIPANGTYICYFNRPFYQNETTIWNLLGSNQIEFVDDNNNVMVDYRNLNNNLSDVFTVMNAYWSNDTDYIEDLRVQAGQGVLRIIRGMFARVNPANYGKVDMLNAMGFPIYALLDMGDCAKAGNLINNLPVDAFFTAGRKTKLKSYCDAVTLP